MKLGRNDPCHCGSGKKYKYCHYEEDRAKEAKALQEESAARAAAAAEEGDEGDDKNAARAKSTAAKAHKQEGSRFLRDSSRAGHAQKSSVAGTSPRSSRGAQRGG